MSTSTGSRRIVAAEQQYIYEIQNVVDGEEKDAHVARLLYYANKVLEITPDLKEVF